jgi:hypothetical protein
MQDAMFASLTMQGYKDTKMVRFAHDRIKKAVKFFIRNLSPIMEIFVEFLIYRYQLSVSKRAFEKQNQHTITKSLHPCILHPCIRFLIPPLARFLS